MCYGLKIFVVALFLFFLVGCATTIPLSPQEKRQIKTVSVRKISIPAHMYYQSVGDAISRSFFAGGLIDAAVESASNSEADKLQAVARASHVHVNRVVQRELIKEINANTHMKTVGKNADAKLFVTIKTYGIDFSGFSGKYIPVLSLQGVLVRNGKVVWQNQNNRIEFPHTTAHTLDEIYKNPEVLYGMWDSAAKIAVADLLKKM